MNIEQLAIEAGVIYVDEGVLHSSLYWTENNAIEVLEKFAQLVLANRPKPTISQSEKSLIEKYGKEKTELFMESLFDTPVDELIEELFTLWTPEYLQEVMDGYDY